MGGRDDERVHPLRWPSTHMMQRRLEKERMEAKLDPL